jgi:DNA-binding NarL/FixJ family response regulator
LNSERPRVLVVDDHALLRAGVRAELEGAVDIVGEAGTVAEAIARIAATKPDVVLLDVHMPDGGGLAVMAAIGDDGPRVLALSVSDAPEDVIELVRAGAAGYVTKTISAAELTDAIRRVARGQVVLSQRLAGFVLAAFSNAPSQPGDAELSQLTRREQEVLEHIARGYLYKEIAAMLGISARTVESHVSSVLHKLHLTNRHQLAHWANQHRMLD